MIDLRHNVKLKYLGLILIVLISVGLGTAISTGNYIKLAAIIASAILLFLSPFQLLLLLLVCFQFPYAFLPKLRIISPIDLKSVAQVDLNLGDLIYLIIIIKLALDFMLNRLTIRWNWKVPTKLKLLIYLFIAIGLMVQMKVLVLKDFPIFWFSTVSYLRFLSGLLLVFIVPTSITYRNQLKIFVI